MNDDLRIDNVYINARWLLIQPGSKYIRNEGLHFNDTAYCLDALDCICAGSVIPMRFGPDEDDFIPALSTSWRNE